VTDDLSELDGYWPDPLQPIPNENPLATREVVVAEISTPWGPNSYRQLYTALAPNERVDELLHRPGGIGHEVSSTGPHPMPYRGSFDYQPRFWIWAGDIISEELEPLVVAWNAGGRTVMVPDQGFLMTYGLIPRAMKTATGDCVHWDDLEKPRHSVVIAEMVSEFYYLEQKSIARVTIDREYLQDYATVRNCSLIQVYYASNQGTLKPQDSDVLAGKRAQEFKLPGRLVDIQMLLLSPSDVIAQVWGVRRLLDPGDSPVIQGRWDYGNLVWPGVEGEVTFERAKSFRSECAYIRDDVLGAYEEYPDRYSIYPEHGSVAYRGQWSVSYCRRVSRDLVKVEIKKLYEGCPPEVVSHWHHHAVDPPMIDEESFAAANIGARSKRIVYALTKMGEIIADMANRVMGTHLESIDFVKLSRADLDYYGWCKDTSVVLITRHVPLTMGKSNFLERCKDLNSLIVEGLSEGNLRTLLLAIGVDTGDLRGLKLLDLLIQYGIISCESALRITSDSNSIKTRLLEKQANKGSRRYLETPIDILFTLYDLRLSASHAGRNTDEALGRLGIDLASVEAGWGSALDKLYDAIGMGLESAARILQSVNI
jgi:hypothetical protein